MYIINGMKKAGYGFIVLLLAGLILFACLAKAGDGGKSGAKTQCDFIRIHIRANSNGQTDQTVKYAVKEEAVAYLTPLLAACENRADVEKIIGDNLSSLSRLAAAKLRQEGFSYGARAEFKQEYFPARDYDGVTLNSGLYDALILYLGAGEGDNWWCVVYPPLCFVNTTYTDGEGIKYKSKLKELVKKWFSDT